MKIWAWEKTNGKSSKPWEEAARNAVESHDKTLHDLRVAEIRELDMKVEEGKVVLYRAKVTVSFKYKARHDTKNVHNRYVSDNRQTLRDP